jgi:hypothetical protein
MDIVEVGMRSSKRIADPHDLVIKFLIKYRHVATLTPQHTTSCGWLNKDLDNGLAVDRY